MDDFNNSSTFYYFSIFAFASASCIALLVFLDWPLLAELPLAICILIQTLALSKKIYSTWFASGEEFSEEIYSKTKAVFLGLDTQEEELSLWKNKKAS